MEAAVRVFEKSEWINAGRGSALNCFGEVECDAMIMNGENMKTGTTTIYLDPFLHIENLNRSCQKIPSIPGNG